jgi:hypothetical protein
MDATRRNLVWVSEVSGTPGLALGMIPHPVAFGVVGEGVSQSLFFFAFKIAAYVKVGIKGTVK